MWLTQHAMSSLLSPSAVSRNKFWLSRGAIFRTFLGALQHKIWLYKKPVPYNTLKYVL